LDIHSKLRVWNRNALIIFAFWTFIGTYSSIQVHISWGMAGRPMTWERAFFSEFTYAYAACALTPFVLALARRFPIERQHWFRNLLIHVAVMPIFSAVIKLTWDVIASPPDYYTHTGFTYEKMFRSILSVSDFGAILYGLIVLMHHATEYYRRYQQGTVQAAQLQTQLAQAQVRSLKMQLHPHFLFNTLNSISALIQEDPEGAEAMIARLSDLLRRALENSAAEEIPLRQELDFLNLYLEIERIRFEERLRVEFDIEPVTEEALVPNLLLQPLVENAIRHGIANRVKDGHIRLSAKKRGGDLLLKIADNGSGLSAQGILSLKEGVGLTSTRGRLERLYGSGQRLQLEASESGGVIARIVLPFATQSTRTGNGED
jgi:two-component sensor histidine kinase